MMARVSMIVPAAFAMTFMWVGQAEEFSPQQERIALAFLDLAKCFVDSHKKVGELTLAVANKVISNLEHLFLVIYILELLLALARRSSSAYRDASARSSRRTGTGRRESRSVSSSS